MYINAVANSVMLQLRLRHDYHNIIFKIKHKLHTVSGLDPLPSPTPSQVKNSGCARDWSRKSTPFYAFMAQKIDDFVFTIPLPTFMCSLQFSK